MCIELPRFSLEEYKDYPTLERKDGTMVNIIKEELSLEKAFQQAIVSLKLYEIPEDQTPQLYVSEGIEAKNIYLVTKN